MPDHATDGASFVEVRTSLLDDHHHARQAERAHLLLAEEALTGLRQAAAGLLVSDDELNQALGITPPA